MRKPSCRLVEVVLGMLPDHNWKRSLIKEGFGRKVVKEDLRTRGVDRQFSEDVKVRRFWNSDRSVDSMRTLAEARAGLARICSRTTHLDEDAHSRVKPQHDPPRFEIK
ncbi:hypothetical protein RB195_022984 [Necator americanus]